MKWEELELELISLRKELHKYPELAGNETQTAKRIIKFAKQFNPDKIISNIGGEGAAIIFEGKEKGETVLIRCDLDALPIQEENEFNYKSQTDGVSHKCGHDGHMAIVAGLVPILSQEKIQKGRVVLLYQPAEEIGQGAQLVLNDEKFSEIKPDYVFALHNLPKLNKNEIVIRKKGFAAASKGLIVRLKGKTAHAAYPERGITPSLAIAELIQKLTELKDEKSLSDFSLVTIIHVNIGERAFGTTPGYAEIMATLRSYKNDDMAILSENSKQLVKEIAVKHNLEFELEWVEEFSATINDIECVDIITEAAKENNFQINEIDSPFRWSEDFGQFTSRFKGSLFGIGSGIDHQALHNPDYDFPDEIILTGTKMFHSIIKRVLG